MRTLRAVNYAFILIVAIEASFWMAHMVEGSPDYADHMTEHLQNTKELQGLEQVRDEAIVVDEELPCYDDGPASERTIKTDPNHIVSDHSEGARPCQRVLTEEMPDARQHQNPKKGKDAQTQENESVSAFGWLLTPILALAVIFLAIRGRKHQEVPVTTEPARPKNVGIKSIEVYFPRAFVRQSDLEEHDGVSQGKYTIGLGQTEMAVPESAEDATSLALSAVQALLTKNQISPDEIGRLEVGTESLCDYSKSMKTSLLELFGSNTQIEGVSSVNACYGGTAALFNSVAWVESSAWDGRLAIVVASDIAVYEPGPARPTGGGAAVAMLVGPDAVLALEPVRASYAANTYDFYKPCRNPPSEFPIVDGHLSNSCYLAAIDACYRSYADQMEASTQRPFDTDAIDFMAFHAPYNKLVRKSFARLLYNDAVRRPTGSELSEFLDQPYEATLTDRALEKALVKMSTESFTQRVVPSTGLGKHIGNCYTASLYCSLASLVSTVPGPDLLNKRLLMFSYGSGALASLFCLRVRGDTQQMRENLNLVARLADRRVVSPSQFNQMLAARSDLYGTPATPSLPEPSTMFGGAFFVKEVDSKYRRRYSRGLTHVSDSSLQAELMPALQESFTYNGPKHDKKQQPAPATPTKPSKLLGKMGKVLDQLVHPMECAALAKFLLNQRKNKKSKKEYSNPDEAFCFDILNRVSRSFAAVIEGLPPKLRLEVAVFYLVLRALDTVEDDMSIPDHRKKAMLRDFANHLHRPASEVLPIVMGYGDTDDYRELLRRYDQVIRVFQNQIEPGAQMVIEDITVRMADGMADFVGATRVNSVEDYELYCHYVAGLVGIGLSKLWAISPEEGAKWSTMQDRDWLSNEMGLFLQKTNITRDYREDIDVNRLFWPREIWSQYAQEPEDLFKQENLQDGLAALNHMITDSMQHIPACLQYLELLSDPAIFKFCAIPQVMAIATMNALYNNPKVLHSEVKIRKGKALTLMNSAVDMSSVRAIFYSEAYELKSNIVSTDPSAKRTLAFMNQVLSLTAPSPSPTLHRVLSTAADVTLLAAFATGVHRLSVCSNTQSCQLFGWDGAALLGTSLSVHVLRQIKGDKWVAQALGYSRDNKIDQAPCSPGGKPATPNRAAPPHHKHIRSLPRKASTPCINEPISADKGALNSKVWTPAELQVLPNNQLTQLVATKSISVHNLEALLEDDCLRAASIRRQAMSSMHAADLSTLPLDQPVPASWYKMVHGSNCESVVGYLPLPVGLAGPILVDSLPGIMLPLATTEGALIASTNRGCKALSATGVRTVVSRDGISRAPVVRLPSLAEANELCKWLDSTTGFNQVKAAFEATSSYATLLRVTPTVTGRLVYLRFVCRTGDAMGMNMVSKGTSAAISAIQELQPQLGLELVSISGNACADKKATAVNWVEGRGKSVTAESTIPKATVESVLKTEVKSLVQLNTAKNLVGSAVAGAIGGSNAHAANIVTAMFLATGQDPAQNVESSSCLTYLEETPEGDLYASVTMPSIEVGTVGGGTTLPAQSACLRLMKVQGASAVPGSNSCRLASLIAAGVLAGELSLLSALQSDHLVSSHLKLNRKTTKS